jgi:1-acyl-sn-glycerol-3-phosphate acyltransferase
MHLTEEVSMGEPPHSPRYRLSRSLIGAAIVTSLRGRPRNLRSDVTRLLASLSVEPVVCGTEHLPVAPPFVVVSNHYERKDAVWVGWGAIAISHAIDAAIPGTFPIRWVMTSTWQDCFIGPIHVPSQYLRWVLQRLARLYGLVLMPAHDAEVFGRAAAVRELFRALADPAGQVVAFHPEAGGFETLTTPPPGAGRLLTALDRRAIPLIPTGVFEADGRLQVRFGPAIPAGSLQELCDTDAAAQVMGAIACLIPAHLWGVFAATVPHHGNGTANSLQLHPTFQ